MSAIHAIKAIDAHASELTGLAAKMWETPEVGYNEVNAAKWNAELLESLGFKAEIGYANLPTCVRGVWGEGHPIIGFLGELDALPGLSQKLCTTMEPVVENAPGQGCGHNLLASACLGAALGLKAELEARGLPGTVVYYGCPAEELLTGKVFMAREGAFKDLDIAFAWHGSSRNSVGLGTSCGLNSAIFHFYGRTAHAGGDPQNGRSALDAVELMNVGANYLREHVTMDTRIHYVTKEGGTAPNIVPDKAAVWYYVRALSREAIEETYERLVRISQGAALMTDTRCEIEFLGGCYNTMPNKVLTELIHETMSEVELPKWSEEDLRFAEELNLNSPRYEAVKASGVLENGPLSTGIEPISFRDGYGSTDVADVEHIVPCASLNTATYNLAAPGHSWQITACAGNGIGHKGMLYGAKVLAAAAIKAVENPELITAAKAEFEAKMKNKPYKCPIPKEIPIPQPKK